MFDSARKPGRWIAGWFLGLVHAGTVLSLLVPADLIRNALPAKAEASRLEADLDPGQELLDELTVDAAPFGLVPFAQIHEKTSGRLLSLTAVATVPYTERTSPTFFFRRTRHLLAEEGVRPVTVAEEDLTIAYEPPRVTIHMISVHFPPVTVVPGDDEMAMAATEVHRTIELDVDDLQALDGALPIGGRGGAAQSRVPPGVDPESYREIVTVISPDGAVRTYDAGGADRAAVPGLGSGGGGVGCISDCFADNGGEIGFAGAVCLVGGLVVCGAVCAGTVGVGCFPCIAGAGTVCGVAVAGGALTYCIIDCTWPGAVTPTPTRRRNTPTRSPTPTPTRPPSACVAGDCNEDSSVSISDLVLLVRIVLGISPAGTCPGLARAQGTAPIGIDYLVRAVRSSLDGCPR